ncbi:M1 family aminopeptidase [uncultured Thiodictyon sp.]|uniref:M1 family metallopeptidase n=1 Tax=uncultured Thiodictyon sp. TaxID=1846217 RepID=UPI0025FD568E|nr:M1 family aminopeptidase [uncultured Thiodictyon sp.]
MSRTIANATARITLGPTTMHAFLPPAPVLALFAALPLALFQPRALPAETPVVDHAMEITLDPAAGTLTVTDRLTLPPGLDAVDLVLHDGLAPRVLSADATLEPVEPQAQDEHLTTLRLRLAPAAKGTVTLAYGGTIRHGLVAVREGMGRERQESVGTIGPDGVFLDGASGWYPRVPGTLQRFDLRITAPPGWNAISQGAGPDRQGFAGSAWTETQPQDDIYLVAAPFTLYRDQDERAQVWLRAPNEPLAARYLAATREYLDLYSRLIGPYAYAKFALVENFWESGYGMPSFTLLGPAVIRLPFIIDTSYPHEVLHNWWGNGVFVEERTGNWSEGLTTYLADHLMKEREGQGAAYRRDALQTYADFVHSEADFPLTAFRARHGEASQAIGYGKSAMLFHGLRVQLGDAAFVQGLKRFYADNRLRAAGYADLRRAFEATSGRDLKDYFTTWTTRTGAARLALTAVRSDRTQTGAYQVSGRVLQTQREAPFPLTVPVVVHQVEGPPQRTLVELTGREGRFAIDVPTAPVRLAVDPEFDCFRTLEPGESPVALGGLFGAEQGLILLPGAAQPALLSAYRALATAWQGGHPQWRVALDQDQPALPADRAVWVLGWENRFIHDFAAGAAGFSLDPAARTLAIAGTPVALGADASLALTRVRDGSPLGLLATDDPTALPGLARKLPHYGKYGYLVFAGAAPDNRLKGQWPPGDSPLIQWFGDARPVLAPVPRPSLVETHRP